MKTLHEIRPIKNSEESRLLKKSGVTGVDIGYKIVGGEKTDNLAIRVYVAEKKSLDDIPTKQRIPKTIKGVKTDVIARQFQLNPLMIRVSDLQLMNDTSTYDPLEGGISIGPCRSIYFDAAEAACHGAPGPGWYFIVGTLGAFVRDNTTNAEMMLSNFHVMCVDDTWSVGDTMAQPSRVDGGSCPADTIGSLQRASLGGKVDCAIADHTARDFHCGVVDIGDITGKGTASPGMAVRKRGRTTGLTYGTVDTVDLSVTINYCNGLGTVTLTNQIGIDVDPAQSAVFGISGDSGSVVVDGNRKVVGLYFAGNTESPGEPAGIYGVANPIQAVLDQLDVYICVPPLKKVEPEPYPIKKIEPEPYPIKKIEPEPIKKVEPEPITKWEPEPIRKGEPEPVRKGEPEPPIGKSVREPIGKAGHEPRPPYLPGMPESIEDRFARLEAAIAQLSHFIKPEMRPDADKAPLRHERGKNE